MKKPTKKYTNGLIQAAKAWNGESVKDIFELTREAIEITTTKEFQDSGFPSSDFWDDFETALSNGSHDELWPDDLSNAFHFIAIDSKCRALVTEFNLHDLHISDLSDDDEDEPEPITRLAVILPVSFHKAVQFKALQDGVKIGPKVRELLEKWVNEE